MKTLKKDEKDLKVIAEFFAENNGCSAFRFCAMCPFYIWEGGCKIGAAGNRGEDFANKESKKWAEEYLKLEFLEELT
jgi:hypothetical protein